MSQYFTNDIINNDLEENYDNDYETAGPIAQGHSLWCVSVMLDV